MTFILTVTNNGDQILENVILTDPILSYFNILQASSTKGTASFDTDENVVTVTIGSLEPDEIVIVTIVVEVNNTTDFSAEVPNTAALTFVSEGVTESEASNTVCFRIEGVPEERTGGLSSPLSLGILAFGILGLLIAAYGFWRRSREEQDGRRYIIIGLIIFLLSITVYVAFVFLPSRATFRGQLFPECETSARYMELSLSRTFPLIVESAVNAVKELYIL